MKWLKSQEETYTLHKPVNDTIQPDTITDSVQNKYKDFSYYRVLGASQFHVITFPAKRKHNKS